MKLPNVFLSLTFTLLAAGRMFAAAVTPEVPVSLAGQWRFAMDREDAGFTGEWFNRDLTDRIRLPGILQAQGYGDDISVDTPWVMALGRQSWLRNPQFEKFSQPGNVSVAFLTQPPKHYLGVAWYQRDIDIPQSWAGKRVELFLERTRWQTTVWVDGQRYAYEDSLVAPHITDLGILTPGKHRLTVRIDNRMMYRQRVDGHSVADGVGATWNGIAGKIELRPTTPVWIQDAQVFPNIAKKSALVKVKIGNVSGQPGSGTLTAFGVTAPATWDATGGTAQIEVPFGDNMKLWDEFHPNLSFLPVTLVGTNASDAKNLTFGFREITFKEKDMFLNGRPLNIRGTHFGGDFPITGYQDTNVETWRKIIQTCKDFGMNHMRFHSWCPPEAAFIAADELGFYLQPEGPFWDGFSVGSPVSQRLDAETARMILNYGNHPSFLLCAPSNESSGAYGPIWAKTNYENDPRRLWATTTGIDARTQFEGGAQYAIMAHTQASFPGVGGQLRVSDGNQIGYWFGSDYGKNLEGIHIPVLSHELGQWCAYPDFDVVKRYTGFAQPRNYEIFRDSAATNGVLDRNKEFAWASGKFQLACYKAEIETNLRTPGLSGFQLLELHDNTEQGTALIGVLDPLWQPKGYVTGPEYRRFSGDTVPLARLSKRTFSDAETLTIPVELYNFGEKPLANTTPYWKVMNLAGNVVAQGTWAARDFPLGKNIPLGEIALDFSKLPAPMQYKVVVGLTGTKAENDWNIWVYRSAPAAAPADVLVTHSWPEAEARLAAGGKVLYTPGQGELVANLNPPLSNVPVFWNRQMNPNLSAMLGLWCDAKHPALAKFPTEAFCDWQWADLVRGVRAINIGTAPAALKPIVSAVDDWNRNWKLGVIFEAKVGNGRLLVSAIDLDNNRTSPLAARQLRESLVDYMAGGNFNPATAMTVEQARSIWPGGAEAQAPATPTAAPPPEIDTGSTRVIPRA